MACLPLIEADLPAVLSLDQRCLGGLWTRSGYQRELDSDCSDLLVLVSAPTESILHARASFSATLISPPAQSTAQSTAQNIAQNVDIAAGDPTVPGTRTLTLLGIGCLWAILEEAHITTLAIEPTQQGQKLGQWLLTELLLHGYRRELERATLEVRASNFRALKLYQKFNFKEAGIRKRYYSDGEHARILWRNKLQEPAALENIAGHRQVALDHLSNAHQPVFHLDIDPY